MSCMNTGSDKGPRRGSNLGWEDDQWCFLEDVSLRLRPQQSKAVLAKGQEEVSRGRTAPE